MSDYATAHGWPPFNEPEVGIVIGRHSDELRLEDAPSRSPAARGPEPWWRPRHRAES